MLLKKYINGNLKIKLDIERTIEDVLSSEDLYWEGFLVEEDGDDIIIEDESNGNVFLLKLSDQDILEQTFRGNWIHIPAMEGVLR
jgi:hypothetical protein